MKLSPTDPYRCSDVSPCPKGLLKDQNAVLVLDDAVLVLKSLNKSPWSCPCDCVSEIVILHVALIAKYFTTDKHSTYYLLSSEG